MFSYCVDCIDCICIFKMNVDDDINVSPLQIDLACFGGFPLEEGLLCNAENESPEMFILVSVIV